MEVERIIQCRICGNKNLQTVVDLGSQCLSGRFPHVGEPDPLQAPLELVQCTGDDACGLVQLAHKMPLNELYGDDYGYLSGLNQTMKHHLEDIAKRAVSLVELKPGDSILDIGCNDGTLLRAYDTDGLKIGMDADHYQKYYLGSHILFIPGFFSASLFDSWKPIKKPKIITSIAMFYDLEDPNKFVYDIKKTLHPDGIWILEQSYLPAMLHKTAFDTICHEHLEYYCYKQIKWLLDRYGLKCFCCEFNGSNGGSFRLYVCHEKNSRYQAIPYDWERGVSFDEFNKKIQDIRQRLTTFLKAEYDQGKSIHLYGASTKGNVLLQYMDIDYRLVSLAVDVNTGKNGCWTPGTHIPIYNKEMLPPDYYLVLPWHFRDQFIKQEHVYLQNGGKLLFPLPVPEVVSIEGGEIVVRQI